MLNGSQPPKTASGHRTLIFSIKAPTLVHLSSISSFFSWNW